MQTEHLPVHGLSRVFEPHKRARIARDHGFPDAENWQLWRKDRRYDSGLQYRALGEPVWNMEQWWPLLGWRGRLAGQSGKVLACRMKLSEALSLACPESTVAFVPAIRVAD